MHQEINMIAAYGARTRSMGKDNDLIWHGLKPDKQRFKGLTMGHPVLMGSKTYFSIPEKYRPLPGRTNIVLSKTHAFIPGAHLFRSLDIAVEFAALCEGGEQTFIAGGGEIYRLALEELIVDRMYLTEVFSDAEGDVTFPTIQGFDRVIQDEMVEWGPPLRFLTLQCE
jgi:dihydrofolate reductase